MPTFVPLATVVVVGVFGLAGLQMVLAHLRDRDERRQVKLDDVEKKYVDERIAEIDKALGKTLAPILDDIGQIRTRLNITQKM